MSSVIKPDKLYETRILTNTISIQPKDLNVLDIDKLVLTKLIQKIGTNCISDGIVNTDTIQILKRSLGNLYNHDLSGSIHYTVSFEADVCNPRQGQIVKCVVDEHTDTQTICYIGNEQTSPLEIYLSKQNYIGNKDYASLKKGDNIYIKVVACNIEAGRNKIDTIGEFLKKI